MGGGFQSGVGGSVLLEHFFRGGGISYTGRRKHDFEILTREGVVWGCHNRKTIYCVKS